MMSDDRIEALVQAVLGAVDARIDGLRREVAELRAEVARLGRTADTSIDTDLLTRAFETKLAELVGALS